MGFIQVYRYVRGKADWIVRGLPAEPPAPLRERMRTLPYFIHNLCPAIRQGWIALSRRPGVGQTMRDDLPRIAPAARLPPAFERTVAPLAIVLDPSGVVLGAIDEVRPAMAAAEAMNPAPQTIRPDMTHALAAMLLRQAPYLLVTTADGRYLGRYTPQHNP
jgi:hypothetical protein